MSDRSAPIMDHIGEVKSRLIRTMLVVLAIFCGNLRDVLSPVGAVEEFMVDKFNSIAWRSRRVLKFENSVISTAFDNLEKRHPTDHDDDFSLIDHALTQEDPLAVDPEIWSLVFLLVDSFFGVDICKVLNLEETWEDYEGFSANQIQTVIEFACDDAKISDREFWSRIRKFNRDLSNSRAEKQEQHRWERERIRNEFSLPPEQALSTIQRHESHLSRELYKVLHEIQRLQAARPGLRPTAD